mgnify:CR=1 FL=1
MNHWRFIGCVWLGWIWAGTAVVTCAAPAPSGPLPARKEVEAALARPAGVRPSPQRLRIVLLADKKDHGPEAHDYPLWQQRWALLLGGKNASTATQVNLYGPPTADPQTFAGASNVEVLCANGWPTESQFASADAIVAFCYLAWNEERRQQVKRYLDRGGGLVLIHAATWTKPRPDSEVAAMMGVGGFLRYRHGSVQLEVTAADHPICKGLPRQLVFEDETYWPPTPPIDASRVTVLAVSREKTDTVGEQTSPQPIFWTCQTGRGRVFGCVLGHYTWTFDDPWFRILLLRGIAWSATQPVERLEPLVLRGARVAP